jgi:hypothetical protein
MFIADDLKTLTVEAIEAAIAIAMMELVGGKVVCRLSRVDISGAGAAVDLGILNDRCTWNKRKKIERTGCHNEPI